MLREVEETMGAGERAAIAIARDLGADLVLTMNGGAKKRDGMDSM
ncbi:putative nucleic acid-binding protein [Salinibacter ruber]|nr:putative nucleic acid-binding protein [Salinibacter ruber]